MYDVPQSDIHTVVVDAAVVRGQRPPHYFRGAEQPDAALVGSAYRVQTSAAARRSPTTGTASTPPPPTVPQGDDDDLAQQLAR